MGKIFNPEIREYFNVDTKTVKNKLIKILFPFKEYEFEYFFNLYFSQIRDKEVRSVHSNRKFYDFDHVLDYSQGNLNRRVICKSSFRFQPNLFRKTVWILIFTVAEVLLAKGTQNSISNLNIGILELCSLVSYRYVSLSVVVVILVLTNMSIPYLHFIGIAYVFLVDTYYVVIINLTLRNWNLAVMPNKSLPKKDQGAKYLCWYTLLSLWQ